MASNIVSVVIGDSFWESPELRRHRAIVAVNEAPGKPEPTLTELVMAEYEQTEAQQLAEGFDGADPSDRLAEKVSNTLGTPYRVWIERDMCTREFAITIRCAACGVHVQRHIDEELLERVPQAFDIAADDYIGLMLGVRASDELDENDGCWCADGLPAKYCLQRFTDLQALDHASVFEQSRRQNWLTEAQREVARRMWSRRLRAKQAEAREKERCQVVCDPQDEP